MPPNYQTIIGLEIHVELKTKSKMFCQCQNPTSVDFTESRDNPKKDIIIKAKSGIKFLGVNIYLKGRMLNKRNRRKIQEKLNLCNVSSYYGSVKNNESLKCRSLFSYLLQQ